MADNIIDELNIEIKANANSANSALGELLKKMNALDSSLSRLNGSSLQGLASGVAQLSHSMSAFNSSGVKTKDFTRIATGLNKLGNVNVQGVSDASRAISTLTSNLYNIGTIRFDAQGLANLTNAISSLGRKTVTQATSNIPLLTQTLTKLINELNKLDQIKFDTQGLANLISAISKLGGKSVTNAIPNISLLGKELKNLLQTLSTAPNVSRNVVALLNAIANLSRGSRRAETAVQSLGKSFSNLNVSSKSLGSQLTNLYAKFLALRGVALGLGNSIKRSMDFLETVNFFEVAMEKVGKDSVNKWKDMGYESAEAYANSFSERAKQLTAKMTGFEIDAEGNAVMLDIPNLGIEPESVMNAQAVYAQMANSIGLIGETSLNTSKALTMLGADWASLRNISFDSAWDKFRSALAGETEAVRALGIDITQATLAQYAYRYGLTQSIYEMDRATKTQLSLIAMLDQSRVAWGDLANTLNSPSNQLRILQNNMVSLSRTIGNLFIPILTKVLPYINGFIIALQRLFQWIGSLLGIKFSSINSAIGGMKNNIGGVGDGVKDLNDGVKDTGSGIDKANKKAKKFKKTLLGFDQLNILNDNSDKTDPSKNAGKGGGAGGIGDIGGGSPILDEAIADLLSEYEKAWDNAFKEMENKANQVADSISDAFKKIWDIAEPTRVSVKKLWDEGLSKISNFSSTAIGDFWNEYLKPMGEWMLSDESGLPRFFNITNDILNEIDWDKLNEKLKTFFKELQEPTKFVWTSLMDFYEYFLKPLSIWTMSEAFPRLVDILTDLSKNIDWKGLNKELKELWKVLEPFAESIGEGMLSFFEDFALLATPFINETGKGFINTITMIIEALKPFGKTIGYVLGALLTWKGITMIIQPVINIFKTLWSIFDNPIIHGIIQTLKKFGTIIRTVFTSFSAGGFTGILTSLETMYPRLYSVIGNIAKLFGKNSFIGLAIVALVSIIVNNWNDIKDTIVDNAIKIGKSVTSLVKKIGKLFTSLKEMFSSGTIGISIKLFMAKIKLVTGLITDVLNGLGGGLIIGIINVLGNAITNFINVVGDIIDTLTSLVDIITGLSSLDFNKVTQGFKDLGSSLFNLTLNVVKFFYDIGKDIIEGIWLGITKSIKNVSKRLKDTVFTPFMSAFKKLFDIHSPSRVMADMGKYIIDGLFNGIKSTLSKVTSLFKTIWKSITDTFKDVGTWFKTKFDTAYSNIKTAFKDIGTWAKEKWTSIVNTFKDVGTWFKTKFDTAYKNIITAFKDMGTWAKGKWKSITDTFKDVGTWFKTKFDTAYKNIKIAFEDIGTWAKNRWSDITNSFKNVLSFFKGKGKDISSGIKQGWEDAWKKFKEWLSSIPSKIATGIGSVFGNENIQKKGSDIVGALKKGWTSAKTELNNWLSSIPEAIATGIGDLKSIGSKIMDGFVKGLKSVKIPTFNVKTKTTNTVTTEKVVKDKKNNKFKIPFFATGGFPDKGQLFVGNENGIEMMGKMGNKNVVANNKQITDGIKQAVYEAVVQANARTKTTQQQNPIIDNKIYIGAEQIARAVTEGQKKLDRRMNPIATF